MSDATKRLREEYLNTFMMRKWITSKLEKLSTNQVEQLVNMIKNWTGDNCELAIPSS